MPQHPIVTGALRRCRKDDDFAWERHEEQRHQQPHQQLRGEHLALHQEHIQQQHLPQKGLAARYTRLSFPLTGHCEGHTTTRRPRDSAGVQPSSLCTTEVLNRASSDQCYPCSNYATLTHISNPASAVCEVSGVCDASASAVAGHAPAPSMGQRKVLEANAFELSEGPPLCSERQSTATGRRSTPSYAPEDSIGLEAALTSSLAAKGNAESSERSSTTTGAATKGAPANLTGHLPMYHPVASSVYGEVPLAGRQRSRLIEPRQTSCATLITERNNGKEGNRDAFPSHRPDLCNSDENPASSHLYPPCPRSSSGRGNPTAAGAASSYTAGAISTLGSILTGAMHSPSDGTFAAAENNAAAAVATASPRCIPKWQIAEVFHRDPPSVSNSAEVSSKAQLQGTCVSDSACVHNDTRARVSDRAEMPSDHRLRGLRAPDSAGAPSDSRLRGLHATDSAGVHIDDRLGGLRVSDNVEVPSNASPRDIRMSDSDEVLPGARLSTDAFRLNNTRCDGPAYRLSSSVIPTSAEGASFSSNSSWHPGDYTTLHTLPFRDILSPFRTSAVDTQRPGSSGLPLQSHSVDAAGPVRGALIEQRPSQLSSTERFAPIPCADGWTDRTDIGHGSDAASAMLTGGYFNNSPLRAQSTGTPRRIPSTSAFPHNGSAKTGSRLSFCSAAAETPTHRQRPGLLPHADAAFVGSMRSPDCCPSRSARAVNSAYTFSCSEATASLPAPHAAARTRPRSPPALAAHAAVTRPLDAAPSPRSTAAASADPLAAACEFHRQPHSAGEPYSFHSTGVSVSVLSTEAPNAARNNRNTGQPLGRPVGAQGAHPRRSDPRYEKRRGGASATQQQRRVTDYLTSECMLEGRSPSCATSALRQSSSSNNERGRSYTNMLLSAENPAPTQIQHQTSRENKHIAGDSHWKESNNAAATAALRGKHTCKHISLAAALRGAVNVEDNTSRLPCDNSVTKGMQTREGFAFHNNVEHALPETWWNETGPAMVLHAKDKPAATESACCHRRMEREPASENTSESLLRLRESSRVGRYLHACPWDSAGVHAQHTVVQGVHRARASQDSSTSSTRMTVAAGTCFLRTTDAGEAKSSFCSQGFHGEAALGLPREGCPRGQETRMPQGDVGAASEGGICVSGKAIGTQWTDVEEAKSAYRRHKEENVLHIIGPSCTVEKMHAEEVRVPEQAYDQRSLPSPPRAHHNTREFCDPQPLSFSLIRQSAAGINSSAPSDSQPSGESEEKARSVAPFGCMQKEEGPSVVRGPGTHVSTGAAQSAAGASREQPGDCVAAPVTSDRRPLGEASSVAATGSIIQCLNGAVVSTIHPVSSAAAAPSASSSASVRLSTAAVVGFSASPCAPSAPASSKPIQASTSAFAHAPLVAAPGTNNTLLPAAGAAESLAQAASRVTMPLPAGGETRVKCSLPPSLRSRFRVLQQLGKGMYGDVFVCALRHTRDAATSAEGSQSTSVPERRTYQEAGTTEQQQHGQQHQYASQCERHQQLHEKKQQEVCTSHQHIKQSGQHSQQQRPGPDLQRLQQVDTLTGEQQEGRQPEDVEMCSTQRSYYPSSAFSRDSGSIDEQAKHQRLTTPAKVDARAAEGTACMSEAPSNIFAVGLNTPLARPSRVSDYCQPWKSRRCNTATSADGRSGRASAENAEHAEKQQQQPQPRCYGQHQHPNQHSGELYHTNEDANEETRGAGGRRSQEERYFAMKRVRLPTSKLKAIFGIEQQVLREISLLRTLEHVNILRLHAFHFELEPWERRTATMSRGHSRQALLQKHDHHQQPIHPGEVQKQQQQLHGEKGIAERSQNTRQEVLTTSLSSAQQLSAPPNPPPVTTSTAAAGDADAEAVTQEANAPQAELRPEQMFRPTFYLFFELCDCDLAQIIDETYEKFLRFWKTEVKEAAEAKSVEPKAIIQQLQKTSLTSIPRPGFNEDETQLIAYQAYALQEMQQQHTGASPTARAAGGIADNMTSAGSKLFQAIAYCHSRDVMHRDIKPQNIMMLLDREASVKFPWVVKLGDFGLACHAYTRDPCRTKEVVTLLYRPPELLMGRRDYTTAVDVWSAGIVVAEMILGRPPFRGHSSEADLLSRMQHWLGSPTAAELQRFCSQPAAVGELLKKSQPQPSTAATRENRLRMLLTDQFDRQLLSNMGIHFLASVLQTDPELRPSAIEALQHPWLRSVLDRFGNRGVYLQPTDITLPPDFLAVDPINYSFYFSPLQLNLSSENDCIEEVHEYKKRMTRPLVMPWDHQPQPHCYRFDQIRRPHPPRMSPFLTNTKYYVLRTVHPDVPVCPPEPTIFSLCGRVAFIAQLATGRHYTYDCIGKQDYWRHQQCVTQRSSAGVAMPSSSTIGRDSQLPTGNEDASILFGPARWLDRKIKLIKATAFRLQANDSRISFPSSAYGGCTYATSRLDFPNATTLCARRQAGHQQGAPPAPVFAPPLDDVFVGKYSVYWTIRDFQRKWIWRQRGDKASPLRTSRFPFAGVSNFYLQFWPCGHKSAKPGYISLEVSTAETWREFHCPLNLFVGGIKRGPFAFRSPEYFQAANSFCRLEDVDLRNDEITVGFEVAPCELSCDAHHTP